MRYCLLLVTLPSRSPAPAVLFNPLSSLTSPSSSPPSSPSSRLPVAAGPVTLLKAEGRDGKLLETTLVALAPLGAAGVVGVDGREGLEGNPCPVGGGFIVVIVAGGVLARAFSGAAVGAKGNATALSFDIGLEPGEADAGDGSSTSIFSSSTGKVPCGSSGNFNPLHSSTNRLI